MSSNTESPLEIPNYLLLHLSRFINPCAIISTDRHYPIPPMVASHSSEE